MSDLISRSALMNFALNHVGGTIDCNDIARFPAEPVVRHAKYIHIGQRVKGGIDWYQCDNCFALESGAYVQHPFCSMCGAKMDGGATDGSD